MKNPNLVAWVYSKTKAFFYYVRQSLHTETFCKTLIFKAFGSCSENNVSSSSNLIFIVKNNNKTRSCFEYRLLIDSSLIFIKLGKRLGQLLDDLPCF